MGKMMTLRKTVLSNNFRGGVTPNESNLIKGLATIMMVSPLLRMAQ